MDQRPFALEDASGGTPAPAAVNREPYVADGFILVASATKPATEKPRTTVPKAPYVTKGVILLSDADQHDDPALAALQARLQERIARVCGKPLKDVEVTATSETAIAVRVKAYSTLEGEEISNRIFHLPELGPCQVSLDVVVRK